ncbi:MAG: ABC transporter ATP-binding protein [Treponema sp.]|nr:ABC transporter ATP-binding protein [Treponema sp.]
MVELRNICKQYPGSCKKANNNISLELRKGEILCIAGENGAGKTTLMKILCGLETPDAGEIFINGKREIIDSPVKAKNLKIGMVHQHFMLFSEYTVAENIVMGNEPRKWGLLFDSKSAVSIANKLISDHNFPVKVSLKVKDLTLGGMQQVEICRILHCNAQIIILDEPTSILTEHEANSLFNTLKSLVSEGKSLILITHKLREIKKICDRVAVLRKGELAAIRRVSDTDEDEIARLMMGNNNKYINTGKYENVRRVFEPHDNEKAVIAFKNVTVRRRGQALPLLENVSFGVNPGEILAFAGVTGNGLGVIEAVLGGFLHPVSGKITHKGKDISALSIRELRKQGLAYVPADRVRVGSAADASIEENIIINRRSKLSSKNEFSKKIIKDYNIEGAQLGKKTSTLSGGNLQKLILAREIDCLKDYIVFSEPTWGLDIASSSFITGEISALRERGAAIIIISTNLDEILAMADRIMVMYRGKIAGVFANNGDAAIREKIGNCMQGLGDHDDASQ